MTSSILNFGVIGAGRIGQLHAENLGRHLPRARLLAIADIQVSTAQQCAERLGAPKHYSDYRRILDDADVQAVAICSATDTHSKIIEEAAAAGKHIFCEKPIDFDVARIQSALGAVEQAGVALQIGFNRRFDSNSQRLRQGITQGEIGELSQLHITSRDPAPPPLDYVKGSGGIFLDMTIHDFDLARFLVGSEVEEIYAVGRVRIDPAIGEAGDFDTATCVLKFVNGVVATIHNSRQAVFGYDQRVEAFGDAGCLNAENRYPHQVMRLGKEGLTGDAPMNFFLDRYSDSYRLEMDQFITSVQTGAPTPVSGQDGLVPVMMGHAAKRSCEENRPVRLEEMAP